MDTSKYNLEHYEISTDPHHELRRKSDGMPSNVIMTLCPKCSAKRSQANKKKLVLRVDLNNGYCRCYHCGETWRMDSKQYVEKRQKAREMAHHSLHTRPNPDSGAREYDRWPAEWQRFMTQTRGISPDVIRRMRLTVQDEMMPETRSRECCLAFNYFEQGYLVNQKFRTLDKHFKMTPGAELIPYNVDAILDCPDVIITEGEMDCLTMLTAGFDSVISIPSGAQGGSDWMNRFFDLYFADKRRVLIATDMDAPGMKAAEELTRRFGPEVCFRVTFADDCKDANDQLLKHGADSLRQRVEEARPVPLADILTLTTFESELDAFYTNGPQPGAHTGWCNLDAQVSFGTGQLALVTGRTNDGKSEWVDELVLRLMIRTGWNAGFWTPENTMMDHSRKIIEKLCDRNFDHNSTKGVQPAQYELCKRWMSRRLSWVDLPFDQLRLDTILTRCRTLVRKYGIRLLVLDPFNFIEKENDAHCSENAWDSHVVGAIRSFAIRHDVLVFLVAHPRKVEMQIDGRKRRITLEDISGTADFGNKADYCFCIDRDNQHRLVTISIDKVRRKQYGSKGRQSFFVFKNHSGRYCPCSVDDDHNPTDTDFYTDAGMWLTEEPIFAEQQLFADDPDAAPSIDYHPDLTPDTL